MDHSIASPKNGGSASGGSNAASRPLRVVIASLVIAGYVALGFALHLSADAYLLLGIPITIGMQTLAARRPLRALWVQDARAINVTGRWVIAVVIVAIAPAIIAIGGAQTGDLVRVGYGLAGVVGAVGAVHAIRALTRDAARVTVRATLINSGILVMVMVAFRLATGGFDGNIARALATAGMSIATYLPAVFVIEEILFRGVIDPYLHDPAAGADRATALLGSVLWGLWHLPVVSVSLGLLTIPYLVTVHGILGYTLVAAWRRTGNLAAPGIAHAVSDGARNAVAVF